MSPKKSPSKHKALPAVAHAVVPNHAPATHGSWWTRLTAEGFVRGLLLLFAATLPLYYDLAVPEVSGDIRWWATQVFAGLCAMILLGNATLKGWGNVSLRWPPLLWACLGLAIWAMVSLIDALNWTRGVVLMKAMYSQLILVVIVYHVATPAFGRKLLWALVTPLLITSVIGMWQFQGMDDAMLRQTMDTSWIWWVFKPVVWILDPIGGLLASLMGWDNRHLGIAGFVSNFFLQSAVPGSTFANKNLAGSWTAMMLPIALYLLLTSKRWSAQAFASVLLGLGSVFLVYSRARASWVAFFAATMTMAALVLLVPAWRQAVYRHLDARHLWWLLLPVAMLGYWGADKSDVAGYAIDRSPTQQVAALAQSSWNEIGGRLAYNVNSVMITKDHWFNGVGLGSFYTIYPAYYNAVVVTPWNSYNVMARPQRTHTDLMQAFDEMGVPGGILYLSVFVMGIAMALRLVGKAAGGLGGYLIGAGMMTMVLGLTVFLEYQDMIVMPSPWNGLVQVAMAAFIGGMLLMAVRRWRQVRDETQAADDIQLMGFMAGIAVLCISINALFDFPMQLPTAPAATALLLGLICRIYTDRNPQAKWGPKAVLKTGRAGVAALLLLLVLAFGWAMKDSYEFREGNKLLKQGMIRLAMGITDAPTLAVLEKAYDTYPYDQRIVEHIGVAYANYSGTPPIGLPYRIDRMEWVLQSDPWGANHMINLAGAYLQVAQFSDGKPEFAEQRKRALERVEYMFEGLKKVADFSHYTWGIGGMLRLMEGRNDEAMWMFRRALEIEPGYLPATAGIQEVISRTGAQPLQVQDGRMNYR
ncbi:MAG: hypothetical protein EON60_04805 [Alphaproteobacteria bacterium]|nr:MAG: hypothetical protein EON60_04805 [Alphaproteobacteria bacterium]